MRSAHHLRGWVRKTAIVAAAALSIALAGCSSSAPAAEVHSPVAAAAEGQVGVRHSWGGGNLAGPTAGIRDGGVADSHGDYESAGFDGPSLVRYAVFQGTGIDLPRTSVAQLSDPRGVTVTDPAELQPGDIVVPGPMRVAVYIGDGKAVEARQSGELVEIRPYTPSAKGFVAKRFTPERELL